MIDNKHRRLLNKFFSFKSSNIEVINRDKALDLIFYSREVKGIWQDDRWLTLKLIKEFRVRLIKVADDAANKINIFHLNGYKNSLN